MQLPHCPKCNSEYTYEDNGMFICPECAHEWNDAEPSHDTDTLVVKDANGNLLADGDSVTVIKDLKVKGSSSMLKIGTKVKNIRLVEGDHNIDCKIDGFTRPVALRLPGWRELHLTGSSYVRYRLCR